MPVSRLSWLSYGNDPLPSHEEALASPLRGFPNWYLRMECATCGQERYLSETHLTLVGWGDLPIGDFIKRLRHEGCGGEPKLVELLTGIPGSSSGRVRRIVLVGD
jgi:hypothetical protein